MRDFRDHPIRKFQFYITENSDLRRSRDGPKLMWLVCMELMLDVIIASSIGLKYLVDNQMSDDQINRELLRYH